MSDPLNKGTWNLWSLPAWSRIGPCTPNCALPVGQLTCVCTACSAVDLHTADHIFGECIEGMFANKAVVLVTHQLQFIRRCAKVAIVDAGTLQYFGPFNAEAQRVMARYLPVPDEDVQHVVEAKQRVARSAIKVAKVRPLSTVVSA